MRENGELSGVNGVAGVSDEAEETDEAEVRFRPASLCWIPFVLL